MIGVIQIFFRNNNLCQDSERTHSSNIKDNLKNLQQFQCQDLPVVLGRPDSKDPYNNAQATCELSQRHDQDNSFRS